MFHLSPKPTELRLGRMKWDGDLQMYAEPAREIDQKTLEFHWWLALRNRYADDDRLVPPGVDGMLAPGLCAAS